MWTSLSWAGSEYDAGLSRFVRLVDFEGALAHLQLVILQLEVPPVPVREALQHGTVYKS